MAEPWMKWAVAEGGTKTISATGDQGRRVCERVEFLVCVGYRKVSAS